MTEPKQIADVPFEYLWSLYESTQQLSEIQDATHDVWNNWKQLFPASDWPSKWHAVKPGDCLALDSWGELIEDHLIDRDSVKLTDDCIDNPSRTISIGIQRLANPLRERVTGILTMVEDAKLEEKQFKQRDEKKLYYRLLRSVDVMRAKQEKADGMKLNEHQEFKHVNECLSLKDLKERNIVLSNESKQLREQLLHIQQQMEHVIQDSFSELKKKVAFGYQQSKTTSEAVCHADAQLIEKRSSNEQQQATTENNVPAAQSSE